MTKQELIEHWLKTGEVLPPCRGNNTYLGFPTISNKEGLELAKITGTWFHMGEFIPPHYLPIQGTQT